MRKLRWGSSALVGAVLLVLSACGANTQSGSSSSVTVGALLPLTGPAATLGKSWRDGVELGVDRVNKDGGIKIGDHSYRVVLKVLDDQSTPEGAQRGIQKLLNDDVKFYYGPALSTSFTTTFSSLQGTGDRLVMTPSSASAAMLGKKGSENLFNTLVPYYGKGGMTEAWITQDVQTVGIKKAAILTSQDALGDLVNGDLSRIFKDLGVKVVYNGKFDPATRDFGSYVSAMRGTGADMVAMCVLDAQAGPLLEQAVQTGFTAPQFGNACGTGGPLKAQAGLETSWPIQTRSLSQASDDPKVTAFEAAFKAKYNRATADGDAWALTAYDPILVMATAMQKAGTVTNIPAISNAMKSVSSWDGQVLDLTFDKKGQAHYSPQWAHADHGRVTYEPLNLAD